MKIVTRIGEVIMGLFVLTFVMGEMYGAAVMCAMMGAALELIYRWSLNRNRREQQRYNATQQQVYEGNIAAFAEQVTHVSGLPLAQNTPCTVEVWANELRIISSVKKFRIPNARIQGSEQICSTDTQLMNGGGIGRAIVWSFIANPGVGAVAGMSKVKKVETKRYFTCVYYLDTSGKDACLVFENKNGVSYVNWNTTLSQQINRFAASNQPMQTM